MRFVRINDMGSFDYKNNKPWAQDMTIVMQLGLTMAGCLAFCFGVGYWLDSKLGTRGVFVAIGILLGVAGGANVCYRQIMDITEEPKADREDQDPSDMEGNGPG